MTGTEDREFVVLLSISTNFQAMLARDLLVEAGIPCLLEGPDFDVVELGQAAHDSARGRDVLVPRERADEARALLEEAWGEETAAKYFPT